MKLYKKLMIIILFFVTIIALKNTSYAGTQRLNSLDYNVQLNSDGSANVVETWNIYISQTNTLFKDFNLDSSKYSGITNVRVKNMETGEELTEIFQEIYHVTRDCYYGLPIKGNKFEIAWGVGLDDSSDTRKYQISYTIQDAVKVYNDCSEFYWMFLGTDNGIPADRVTGVIKLPKSVSDIEKFRVWAHGPLTGEIQKESRDTAIFSLDNLSSQTMVEVRIAIEEPIFTGVNNQIPSNKLNEILNEEQEWADQANRERQRAIIILIAIGIVYLLGILFFLKKIIKYWGEYKSIPKMQLIDNIGKYFRDIPDEKYSTPASAAYLYYSKKNRFGFTGSESKVFSATLLDLALKKCISFEQEGKNLKINILKEKDEVDLSPSEEVIFKFLNRIGKEKKVLTISDIKKYARINYDNFHDDLIKLESNAKSEIIKRNKYDKENENLSNKYKSKATLYIIAIFMSICFGIGFLIIPIIVEWLISILILRKTSQKISVLTEDGEIERLQWKGLKNYMEDFSLLKEKDVPDLILWEKYLVYATAFGISEKVIKQLKDMYPEFNNLDDSRYCYMPYITSSDFGNGFMNELTKGIDNAYSSYRSAYNTAHSSSSSGSGGGGGFSSGGGGRRRRRPEWAEDKIKAGSFVRKLREEDNENRNRYWRKSYRSWNY